MTPPTGDSPAPSQTPDNGPNGKRKYDWIVFDSTGTLMSPEPEAADVYHAIGARFGCSRSLDDVRSDLKQAIKTHFFGDQIDQPTDEAYELARWRKIVSETLPGLAPAIEEEAFHTLWHQFAQPNSWRLYDEVRPLLERLRNRGYQIAAASNFDGRLRTIAAGLRIDELLDEILISSELGFSKPSTRFYEVAFERLSARDPARMLMIGDTFRGDVEAAREAGWHARHLVRDSPGALTPLTSDL